MIKIDNRIPEIELASLHCVRWEIIPPGPFRREMFKTRREFLARLCDFCIGGKYNLETSIEDGGETIKIFVTEQTDSTSVSWGIKTVEAPSVKEHKQLRKDHQKLVKRVEDIEDHDLPFFVNENSDYIDSIVEVLVKNNIIDEKELNDIFDAKGEDKGIEASSVTFKFE